MPLPKLKAPPPAATKDGQSFLPGTGPCCAACPYGVRRRCEGPTLASCTSDPDRVGCLDPSRQSEFYADLHRHIDPSYRDTRPVSDLPPFVAQLFRGMPRASHLRADELHAVSLSTVLYREGSVRFHSAFDMRKALRLPEEARMMLVGTAPDLFIERFWERAKKLGSVDRLIDLDFELVTTFTYSVYEVDSRFDQIYNQERNFLTYDWFVQRGVPAIPFLFCAQPEDYAAVAQWFAARPGLDVAAVLAQFYPSESNFRRFLDDVDRIQEAVDRPVRWVVVGAGTESKIRRVFERSRNATVVCGRPVMEALRGRVAAAGLDFALDRSVPRARALESNLQRYRDFCSAQRKGPHHMDTCVASALRVG